MVYFVLCFRQAKPILNVGIEYMPIGETEYPVFSKSALIHYTSLSGPLRLQQLLKLQANILE